MKQLHGNREADQRLCFATRIVQLLYFLNQNFKLLASFCACTGRFVSNLFGNHIVCFPTRRLKCSSVFCFQTLIDYLKFDIEFKEWKAIQNMALDSALDNVKQLGFELHFKHPQDAKGADLQITKDDFLRMYENLKILEDMNFKKFNYRLNPFCNYASNFTKRIRSRCYELHYMNMRFVKLHHMKGLDRKVAMLN